MFDYFDANDFELNLTNQTAALSTETTQDSASEKPAKDEEEEKVSSGSPKEHNPLGAKEESKIDNLEDNSPQNVLSH
jgi:hypothetical protein